MGSWCSDLSDCGIKAKNGITSAKLDAGRGEMDAYFLPIFPQTHRVAACLMAVTAVNRGRSNRERLAVLPGAEVQG